MEMAFGIPIAIYALVRFVETRRARWVAALVAAFWIQAASVWYYAIILTLGLAAVLVQAHGASVWWVAASDSLRGGSRRRHPRRSAHSARDALLSDAPGAWPRAEPDRRRAPVSDLPGHPCAHPYRDPLAVCRRAPGGARRQVATREPRRPVGQVLVGALALALVLEYAWMPLPYLREAPPSRPVDAVLSADPADVAVLEWPPHARSVDLDAMFRSLAHGKRVVNGLSGFVPVALRDLGLLMTVPGDPLSSEAQAALQRIYPLRYLVVRLADHRLARAWQPTSGRSRPRRRDVRDLLGS